MANIPAGQWQMLGQEESHTMLQQDYLLNSFILFLFGKLDQVTLPNPGLALQ